MAIRHFIASSTPTEASESRRGFLKTSGLLGGALMVGFWALPDEALAAATSPATYDANAFITIGSDDSVILTIAKVEMGQGTYTSLPMLIAEELEVDLAKVQLRHSPPDAKNYGLPFGDQFTGGSLSIRTLWEPMRQTGAAARMVLVQAAANEWGVTTDSCYAENGSVVHRPSGRRVSYGKLIGTAAKLPVPEKIALKPPSEFKLIGKPVKRLDAKGKTDGSAKFGIDTIVPNLRFAAVAASPVFGGKLKSVDDKKARKVHGVRDVVKLDDAVAVIADNNWYAKKGLAALDVQWDEGANGQLSTATLQKLMTEALQRPGKVARNDGDAAKVLAGGGEKLQRTYINQMLSHATMEPMNCTVHVLPDSAEIWVGTQVPARARDAVAKLLGLPPERVALHNHYIGGGFGRRLEIDFIVQAAAIAKQVKYPVKVVWSREEDIQHSKFRGMYAHSVSASLDAQGFPVALSHKIAGPSNLATFAPGWLKDGLDIDAVEGSDVFAYDIPNMKTEYTREDGPVPTGFWRGVGPTRNMLVLESFMDELAVKAGKDPLAYRLALLKKDKRAYKVLERAGELAGWGKKPAKGTGRGIALMHAWGTYLAQVIDVTVNDKGDIQVNRVVCVVDCGIVVNPDTVKAQMQGGINFGLTAALFGDITLKNGRVEQSNFHDYPILRMSQAPSIVVDIIPSSEAPGGIGEPGTAGVGAAFVNAIHAATGHRLYTLPAQPQLAKLAGAA
ncbi:xanthine dehydrogenase family protein molybdopterin-binding subunit [Pseudomonas sp.]|uniref:xanthine dehydrogenase family protein molybdopterin-binding subunit n=1 Tax=Pseudomonas sp. TaxID=306 RepID=UPI00260A9772|nr:xanthine dehydrogenase family protein molybdopterin-binding subunit [Pseudomonas sp.]